ncbi:MAG: response regulator [Deltaproteobacteria bacterium]|nr:response regulator [Deltaproteobacteria bacterium]
MPKKVLIVEDEIINAMGLATMLPMWGCELVGMVTSGEAAIQAAEAKKPDVVLMDIAIHGSIDGIGAAREIVGRLKIPVIFMTGYDDEDTIKAAEELKPLAFLKKPFEPARLAELLSREGA